MAFNFRPITDALYKQNTVGSNGKTFRENSPNYKYGGTFGPISVNTGPLVSSAASSVNGKKKKRTSTILNLGSGEGSVNNKQAWKMGV
jgi:hypothetical protein